VSSCAPLHPGPAPKSRRPAQVAGGAFDRHRRAGTRGARRRTLRSISRHGRVRCCPSIACGCDVPNALRDREMGKLVVLMFTAFVDMVGSTMIFPLVPFYATRMGADGAMVGVILASYAVAQLVSAPGWGRFSDRYGRRPAILVGLL